MSRSASVREVKPMLEQLEERAQPSILLSGVVDQLAVPLNNIVKDMQGAQSDLKAQFANLQNNTLPSPGGASGAEQVFGRMVGDWQRILSDNAVIKGVSDTGETVLKNVAFTEFQNGDPLDLVLLTFGPVIGLNVLQPLTGAAKQADGIRHDTNLLNIVGANLNAVNSSLATTVPIDQLTVDPTL